MNHFPDKYEHLVRYYGYSSNRSRGARKQVEQSKFRESTTTSIDRTNH